MKIDIKRSELITLCYALAVAYERDRKRVARAQKRGGHDIASLAMSAGELLELYERLKKLRDGDDK